MSPKPIILVTGATGAQGGSVARVLLRSNKFAVRIFTRNAASSKALQLKFAGAEIAEGDLEDIESIKRALENVYGVFGVTDYWEHFENEYKLGKNLIDAVAQSEVKHLVFSSLANYNKLSKGEFSVPQYDTKALMESYIKDLQLPASFIHASFYYENFLDVFHLQKDEYDSFWFGFPQGDGKLATVSAEDIGGIVSSIFNHPDQYIGRTMQAVGSDLTCEEYAFTIAEVLNHDVYYKHIPRDEYAAYEIPHAEETANTFEVQRLYITERLFDMIESYALNPSMLEFKKWVIKNKEKFRRQVNKQLQAVVD
ncbi:MAG: NmrA/HSCARG family protein [Chitinophagaceae bacterium]